MRADFRLDLSEAFERCANTSNLCNADGLLVGTTSQLLLPVGNETDCRRQSDCRKSGPMRLQAIRLQTVGGSEAGGNQTVSLQGAMRLQAVGGRLQGSQTVSLEGAIRLQAPPRAQQAAMCRSVGEGTAAAPLRRRSAAARLTTRRLARRGLQCVARQRGTTYRLAPALAAPVVGPRVVLREWECLR